MRLLLLCVSIAAALVLVAVGFDWITTDTDPLAFLGLSLAALGGALLVD